MPLKGDVIFYEGLEVLTVLPHVVHHQMAVLVMGGGSAIQLVAQRTKETIPATKVIEWLFILLGKETRQKGEEGKKRGGE